MKNVAKVTFSLGKHWKTRKWKQKSKNGDAKS